IRKRHREHRRKGRRNERPRRRHRRGRNPEYCLLPTKGTMNLFRRRRNQYLFVILLGVIGVINVLFFFILYPHVREEYFRKQGSIQKARTDVQSRRQKIDRLEKLSAQLETSAQDRQRLYTTHFIPAETGWSEILPQLNQVTQTAGVKNTRKEYN